MEKKAIKDLGCHGYPLILRENVNKNVDCYGCGKPVAYLEMAYVCIQVHCSEDVILHRKCGELSCEIRHPKHPEHPLHLVNFHNMEEHWCSVCRCDLDNVLGYRCSECDFDTDIICEKIGIDALLEEERKQLQHLCHPDHPLTLMRKPAATFYCDGCGEEDVDMAYICSSCEFWVHKSCAMLPFNRQVDHHHHHLSLAFSFPKEHRKYSHSHRCEVCDKKLDWTSWVYFCGDCRYFVHLKCVGSTTKPDDSNINGGMIKFPLDAHDTSNELIRRFVMREQGIECITDDVNDTSSDHSFLDYHEHPLSLVLKEEEADDSGNEEEDEDDELKICEACVTPISSPPYYACVSCNYSIHSICKLLPKSLCSSSLPHTAELVKVYGECQEIPNKTHKFSLFATSESILKDVIPYECELCGQRTNGMGYECGDCGMKIDVKCASLPPTITHAFHHHKSLLLLTRIPPYHSQKKCRACRGHIKDGRIAYCCMMEECDFALHLECALMWKSVIKREWDKHPLLLLSDASLDHPSDFTCDFCEEYIHPKAWMYHCRQCDVSFHETCLETASGPYRNFKFGRRFKMDDDIHPHPLTFNYVTRKRLCDICHGDLYSHTGFECVSCYYAMCRTCGYKSLVYKALQDSISSVMLSELFRALGADDDSIKMFIQCLDDDDCLKMMTQAVEDELKQLGAFRR